MTEIRHPGYIDLKNLTREAGGVGREHMSQFVTLLEERKDARVFEEYLPFVNVEGLSSGQKETFLSLLQVLYNRDGRSWEPENCRSASSLLDITNSVVKAEPKFKGVAAIAKRLGQDHFWLEIDLGFKELLIVDPYGIPKTYPEWSLGEPENILPYFGPISEAPNYAKLVYEKGKLLTHWGTGALPPNFHP